MADFPAKVSTQTSSNEPQRSYGILAKVDMDFIKSIPGILLLAEIVSCKNHIALSMLCHMFKCFTLKKNCQIANVYETNSDFVGID